MAQPGTYVTNLLPSTIQARRADVSVFSWNGSTAPDEQLHTNCRRRWSSASGSTLSSQQFRSSVFCCCWPVNLKFTAWQSLRPALSLNMLRRQLNVFCAKYWRDVCSALDIFDNVLYEFTLYLLTYLLVSEWVSEWVELRCDLWKLKIVRKWLVGAGQQRENDSVASRRLCSSTGPAVCVKYRNYLHQDCIRWTLGRELITY